MYNLPSWAWNGGWGWAPAFFGTIIVLVIIAVPWFFFLLNLQNLLERVEPRNRAMVAGHVWLNFIPIFNLGWFLYTVVKVKDSVSAEYRSRGWDPEGDQGYNVGLVTGVLAIASFLLGWVPVLGWGMGIAQLVCWILYWLKTSEIKHRLGESAQWPHGTYAAFQGDRSGPASRAGSAGQPPYAQYPGGGGTRPPSSPSAQQVPPVWPAAEPADASSGPAVSTAPPVGEPVGSEGSTETAESEVQRKMCAACGSEYLPGDKFCRTCGLRLP